MKLEVAPTNKLTYKLRLTPRMRLAINLLQMPLLKLKEYIKQEIEKNPLLDIENERLSSKSKEKFDEDLNYDFAANPPTLQEHLLRQLHLLANSDDDRKVGELIIGNINENGYLASSTHDIADSVETTPSKVQKMLSLIQTFDPIGVGARDLRECLLLQLKTKGEENFIAGQIVDKYLPNLEKKRYSYIARKLRVSVNKVKDAMKEIAHLEPKPGRSFNAERTVRLMPDAILRKDKEHYEVIFNGWELPRLTLNAKYKQMIKQKGAPEDAKEYLRERLKAARSLINAVNKRKETIQMVIEDIVNAQKDFLDNGVANFKPMTLEQIAKRIGKHKSTISRAVTNKYLQTPYSIVELRYFLNSGVKQKDGAFFSSKAIKSRIKDLVKKRDSENPLSDQKIVQHLKQEGISISRRTVTKYRNQLKILSSKSRWE